MVSFVNSILFQAFAAVLLIESLKVLFLGTATSLRRVSVKQFSNSEDAEMLKAEAVLVDGPEVSRVFRAHRNSLENLLPFAIVGMLFIMAGGNEVAGLVYFGLFLVARALHPIAYLLSKPLFRRNMYTVGWLVTVIMACHTAGVLYL